MILLRREKVLLVLMALINLNHLPHYAFIPPIFFTRGKIAGACD
jgi:hypothetical protein